MAPNVYRILFIVIYWNMLLYMHPCIDVRIYCMHALLQHKEHEIIWRTSHPKLLAIHEVRLRFSEIFQRTYSTVHPIWKKSFSTKITWWWYDLSGLPPPRKLHGYRWARTVSRTSALVYFNPWGTSRSSPWKRTRSGSFVPEVSPELLHCIR